MLHDGKHLPDVAMGVFVDGMRFVQDAILGGLHRQGVYCSEEYLLMWLVLVLDKGQLELGFLQAELEMLSSCRVVRHLFLLQGRPRDLGVRLGS